MINKYILTRCTRTKGKIIVFIPNIVIKFNYIRRIMNSNVINEIYHAPFL